MIPGVFQSHLARRAAFAQVTIHPALAVQLETYYGLLSHWNARINLTSLPLDPPSDQTIDRLFIEPVAAGRFLSTESPVWLDLGSGNGSPALPLKLAKPGGRLTLVESRERKAAFLREAVRALQLDSVDVVAERFQVVAADLRRAGTADLITVRGVKIDPTLHASIRALLRIGGQILFFGAKRADLTVSRGFELSESTSPDLVLLTKK